MRSEKSSTTIIGGLGRSASSASSWGPVDRSSSPSTLTTWALSSLVSVSAKLGSGVEGTRP
ncbi:hypothetical protein [Baekduia alba]|uniref:hypothetical protein n=1 Tax=Baekduia alba TaxID=2997333 RepID=UPI002341BDD8|nr:hypothetical protein [Baekduia alba]